MACFSINFDSHKNQEKLLRLTWGGIDGTAFQLFNCSTVQRSDFSPPTHATQWLLTHLNVFQRMQCIQCIEDKHKLTTSTSVNGCCWSLLHLGNSLPAISSYQKGTRNRLWHTHRLVVPPLLCSASKMVKSPHLDSHDQEQDSLSPWLCMILRHSCCQWRSVAQVTNSSFCWLWRQAQKFLPYSTPLLKVCQSVSMMSSILSKCQCPYYLQCAKSRLS